MKLKIKQIRPKNNKDLPVFLNFILYNALSKEEESNYCYQSDKYKAIEFYMSNNSKLISTCIDFQNIIDKDEK